jgi:hypothetical protein
LTIPDPVSSDIKLGFAVSILQACFVIAQNGSNGQPTNASMQV